MRLCTSVGAALLSWRWGRVQVQVQVQVQSLHAAPVQVLLRALTFAFFVLFNLNCCASSSSLALANVTFE